MDVRISLYGGWNKTYSAARTVTFSEYINEGLFVLQYYADGYKRVVHNFDNCKGVLINEGSGFCTRYSLGNKTLQKEKFEENIILQIESFDRFYIAKFWEVLEMLKIPTQWNYKGMRNMDGVPCSIYGRNQSNQIGLPKFHSLETGFPYSMGMVINYRQYRCL